MLFRSFICANKFGSEKKWPKVKLPTQCTNTCEYENGIPNPLNQRFLWIMNQSICFKMHKENEAYLDSPSSRGRGCMFRIVI